MPYNTVMDDRPTITEPILGVVVPAYNEEATIEIVLRRLDALDCVKEIVVVDDCSRDRTPQIVQAFDSPRVRLIRQSVNGGKTAAVRRGVAEITAPVTIIQDADLEYDPEEIPMVIDPIVRGVADVVYGSRFLVRRASRVLYFYHYLANRGLTFLSNLFTNINMTDIETCYKAFRTPLIQKLPLTSKGFGMEVEITAMIAKTRARVYEVPISYYGRTYEEGKKISIKDGFAALWYIFYYNTLRSRTAPYRAYAAEINDWLARNRCIGRTGFCEVAAK
ncbi:MAG TPA: glycosyltransferase family 2 protein [Phycisphaerae bacterium]|nr:glycosyltransferase family 2 protein [Phycisphaerae bacterium]HOJ74989.1 glycosyltransferase family 2 protein [Phycisphaerae bacterium]HON67808.1 glycosyltransferase family 2 protein [Phycisphaerae bacterium]HOQ85462.1 glycosyltransferase family 2 protein [Phycisphaerae bacterium]HPU27831.1 glycosyltransferase family 2 protein [Phycisphaerae bacterium]